MQEKIVYPILKTENGVTVENLTITPGGILHLKGWHKRTADCEFPDMNLKLDGRIIEPMERYGMYRPDVCQVVPEVLTSFSGFGIDYFFRGGMRDARISLALGDIEIWETTLTLQFRLPDYDHFFVDTNIKKKSDIYGYGPPHPVLNPEIVSLTEEYIRDTDRVLDFGCGTGKFVTLLRKRGIEVEGLELDQPDSIKAVSDEAKPYAKFYNGQMPLPYPDDYFDVLISTEVLEHIEPVEPVLAEIKRITKRVFLMTVPDATGIPRCHAQNVIPWHFLEETHVNFFTPKNLSPLLEQLWNTVVFHKIGIADLPTTFFANNLVYICQNPKASLNSSTCQHQ